MNNSFGHFNELHRYNQQRRYSKRNGWVIVALCLLALFLIQTVGRPG